MIKTIAQKHVFGCGVACVAFVAQVPYEDVASYLGSRQAESSGFLCRDLIQVLGIMD